MNTMWPLYRLAIGIVAVFALACAAPTPGSQGAAGPSDLPKYGGVINDLFDDDPYDFDVTINGQSSTNGNSVKLAYDSLVGVKFTPGTDGNYWDNTVVPKLAERWEVSPDAKTFTFHLRKDIKWANMAPVNGRELTAADVKFSYEYLAHFGEFKDLPASQQAFAFEGLAGIDTPDPYTVVVRFKESFAPFISWAGSALNPIMPREIYDRDGKFSNQILGTGAFQLDVNESQKGSSWLFKKNPTYRDTGKPYLDAVRYIIIKDDATANAAFQTKQIDFRAGSGANAAEIARTNPNALRLDYRTAGYFMWMHMKKAPTSEFRIRKAIALAIDREAFIKAAGGGLGVWSLAVEVPLFDLFSQEEIKKITPYDPERAKQLVKEAGFPNGVDIELTYSTSSGQVYITMAELANAQLKQVGINLVLKGSDYLESARARQTSNFYMNLITIRPRVDSDGVLFPSFYPGQRPNYAQVDDPKLTALLVAQRKEPDPVKRRELHRQAILHVNQEVIPFVNLYGPLSSEFWHPYVKNYAHHVDQVYLVETWLGK